MNFTSMENGGKSSFSYETIGINVIYPNKWNEFTVPNCEKTRDYYENPCLSQLTNELEF